MPAETTTILIMGASGDLTHRRLLPALFDLSCKGRLPHNCNIVGLARSAYSDDEFRELMWKGVGESAELRARRDDWGTFSKRLFYHRGDLSVLEDMSHLKQRLEELETGGTTANRLFFLSIAPQLYHPAITNLGASGLAREDSGWRRVVIEKPFGWDIASAEALNLAVLRVFSERQVFRIDHYLGKETVQNVLVFRFANAIFEPIWNRNYVDNLQITVAEEVDVGDRAAYYDRSGVVRDMVQNHLLQLLTMVAMEPPISMDADSLRNKKVEVLKAIRRWSAEEVVQHAVRGQYRSYLGESKVPRDSITPTFAALRVYVDNWRWHGVPFYLRSGKAMAKKVSEVVIQFKRPPHMLFYDDPKRALNPDTLTLRLQPDEGVQLNFQVKVPDQGMTMSPMSMEFHYESAFKDQHIPEAYQRLLQDALEGDASLFIRSDHIEEAWRIVDPLLVAWEDTTTSPLYIYEPGTQGPEAADALLAQDGRSWISGDDGRGGSG